MNKGYLFLELPPPVRSAEILSTHSTAVQHLFTTCFSCLQSFTLGMPLLQAERKSETHTVIMIGLSERMLVILGRSKIMIPLKAI